MEEKKNKVVISMFGIDVNIDVDETAKNISQAVEKRNQKRLKRKEEMLKLEESTSKNRCHSCKNHKQNPVEDTEDDI